MADNQQQNGSQQFENAADAQQQQQHLNGTSENSTTNNDSGQFECVRDDDRLDEIAVWIGPFNFKRKHSACAAHR